MDELTQQLPDLAEAPGWVVRDTDGNIVASGPLIELEAVADAGEGEQQ